MPRKVSENADVAYFSEAEEGAGFYVVEGEADTDDNGVAHNTGATPGRRVYPHPDGEGWTYSETVLSPDGTVQVVGADEEEGEKT